MRHDIPALLLGGAAAALISTAAFAQQVSFPPQVTWTAYDTGTSGFNQAVAYGKALKDKYGTDVRVLPGANDISRMVPLKTRRAQFSAMGIGAYFAVEGMDVFAAKDWGPQRIRMLVASSAANSISAAVAGDIGVKEYKDLKGKRVGWVVGSAALNTNMEALLAFGGLTWNDVQKVEFSGYGAMWKGMVANQVDAAIASTISGVTKELEASPRGIVWPPTPHNDEAGWNRLRKVAPYYQRHMATEGTGISKEKPYEGPNYPYPIMITYEATDPTLVYSTIRTMDELYPVYKDGAPGSDGWELKRQDFRWVIPYHDQAVRYFKEKGVWKDEHQKHNDALVKRQDVLAAAWAEFQKTNPADDAYKTAWPKARAAALRKVGMDPVFE
ncbi:MAG: TAXI family TRAP transporter solute-binding subunit [Alphaproteobacteria bacterium]|nr:TAXI family TRAP transporter solute-binding subunit [Alphaproteobacteria bacterium]